MKVDDNIYYLVLMLKDIGIQLEMIISVMGDDMLNDFFNYILSSIGGSGGMM